MKLRFLMIPALLATALFGQGPGGFRGHRQGNGSNAPGTTPTPPTAEQLATREVNMISSVLKLNSTQSAALLALACATNSTTVAPPCILTAEQNALQANATTLKSDWATAATSIAGGTVPSFGAIGALNEANLTARATAAVALLAVITGPAPSGLAMTLSATQQTMLINMLVRGGPMGGPGGFRGGRF